MSELRHDPISRRWVIIATERSRRPTDFVVESEGKDTPSFCPFCEGFESRTPPEIYAIRKDATPPNGPGWQVRVIPNKYPALKIEGMLERKGLGVYDRISGIGAHEVIIETPDHNLELAKMPVQSMQLVLTTYQERLKDLLKDGRFKYILIFKNHGSIAGASLAHPHSQIIATPVTPRTVSFELSSAREHHQVKERCLFCDIMEQEIESGERLVYMDEHFVAFTPYASRFPFEIFLIPRNHSHCYSEAPPEEILSLGKALKEILQKLKKVLKNPPYNFVFHTAPNTKTKPKRVHYWETIQFDYHWHVEILPRLTRIAGFEWGSGFYINPTAPEEAAAFLREAEI